MSPLRQVLVIDDEPDMCRAIAVVLSKHGYTVQVATSGKAGIDLLSTGEFDAVLLDYLMPGMDGLQVLKEIRGRHPSLPVLMISAVDALETKIAAFDQDVDDFITKPFGIIELPARIRAILRRRAQVRDFAIDAVRREFTIGARRVALSPLQFAVMQYLAAHAGQAVTQDELLAHVWEQRENSGPSRRPVNRLPAVVSVLRRKLGGSSRRVLETVPNGYRLNVEVLDV